MELLATPHLATFYKAPEDYRRAYRAKLEDVVQLFPGIAMGDAFQHWIYTHPAHSRAERSLEWVRLYNRFTPVVDWEGLEEAQSAYWHRVLHYFTVPFYLIEYAIAQIGALQVWLRSRNNYGEAVERYWSALALGGSRPLPELFEAAGARFRFDYETLLPLMDAVQEELEKIDDAGA
jgi:oligoendopeptidase F